MPPHSDKVATFPRFWTASASVNITCAVRASICGPPPLSGPGLGAVLNVSLLSLWSNRFKVTMTKTVMVLFPAPTVSFPVFTVPVMPHHSRWDTEKGDMACLRSTSQQLAKLGCRSSHCGTTGSEVSWELWDAGLIPCPAGSGKDLVCRSCGLGGDCNSDLIHGPRAPCAAGQPKMKEKIKNRDSSIWNRDPSIWLTPK